MIESLGEFFSKLGDLEELIKWGGLLVLTIIVFAETGVLAGFFLPGDSLLLTAGLLASQGIIDIYSILFFLTAAAIVGDSFGYWFGKKAGPRVFKKEKSLFFAKDHLVKANEFYEKYGGKTIILARFIPFARTFVPVIAGAAKMRYKTFFAYNVIGGIIWVFSLSLLGYFFGDIPVVKNNFEYVIIGVIVLSSFPVIKVVFKMIVTRYKKPSDSTHPIS